MNNLANLFYSYTEQAPIATSFYCAIAYYTGTPLTSSIYVTVNQWDLATDAANEAKEYFRQKTRQNQYPLERIEVLPRNAKRFDSVKPVFTLLIQNP